MNGHLSMPTRQHGATMIVALIFLVILTLLGTTVASNNTLQERMAGNTRNRDLAFQAAEHALRAGQANLAAFADGSAASLNGLIAYNAATPNTTAQWRDSWPSGSQSVSGLAGVCNNPSYVVEQMPDDPTGNQYYRVTSRGVGACNSNATVILQAMFRRGLS